jgi:putative oxidoreductase
LVRILFGAYFAYSGYNHFKNQKALTAYAKHKGVPSPSLAVTVSGILLIIGGGRIFLELRIVQASICF